MSNKTDFKGLKNNWTDALLLLASGFSECVLIVSAFAFFYYNIDYTVGIIMLIIFFIQFFAIMCFCIKGVKDQDKINKLFIDLDKWWADHHGECSDAGEDLSEIIKKLEILK